MTERCILSNGNALAFEIINARVKALAWSSVKHFFFQSIWLWNKIIYSYSKREQYQDGLGCKLLNKLQTANNKHSHHVYLKLVLIDK